MAKKKRCAWAESSPLMIEYHDTEWGVPVHDDRLLFEFLVLDGAQAGLSWLTVLKKRESFRRAFDQFDPVRVARYTDDDVERLLRDPGIIRNRLKVNSAIANAGCFLEVQQEYGSFDRFIWRFVNGKTRKNRLRSLGEIPAKTEESGNMSRELKRIGFKFVGPTICYAFMQAAGMVNDHLIDCFRYDQV